MSPKDMDFIESKRQASRDIALALGVPPMLLGIPGDNKHDNTLEANRAFWRETVLPLVDRSMKAMAVWLGPAYGGGLELRPDLDAIEALSDEREALWKRIGAATFLTDAEKRAAVGYGPDGVVDREGIEGKFNQSQPRVPAGQTEGGRWSGGIGVIGSANQSEAAPSPASASKDRPGVVQNVVFKTWPSPPNLKAMGVTTLDLLPGGPAEGMVHILNNHTEMGMNSAGKSQFDSYLIPRFDDWLQAGLPFGMVKSEGRGEISIEVHAPHEVGTDAAGARTHDFRTVIVETKSLGVGGYRVITSYPIPDGTAGLFSR